MIQQHLIIQQSIWLVTTTPKDTCTATAIRHTTTLSIILLWYSCTLLIWYYRYSHIPTKIPHWYSNLPNYYAYWHSNTKLNHSWYNNPPSLIPCWYNNLLCYHTPPNSAISLLRFSRYNNTPITIIIWLPQSAILCYSYDHNNSPASPLCFLIITNNNAQPINTTCSTMILSIW
jgi:hypothetical protein